MCMPRCPYPIFLIEPILGDEDEDLPLLELDLPPGREINGSSVVIYTFLNSQLVYVALDNK